MKNPTLKFEGRDPDDLTDNLFIDGKLMNDAVATQIHNGPLKGVHMFSNKERAEEFCYKNGFEPEFETQGEPT